MDANLLLQRIGEQTKAMRLRRGLTQEEVAKISQTTRQKVASIERGDCTIGALHYARVLAALGAEVQVVPARMPVLEELHKVFSE